MSWLGGVRARLTASLVAVVALTAIVLGVSASVFVDLRLHDQVLQAAAEQARFDLSVVVPERQLPDRPTPEDIARSGLADTFRRGAVETFVDLGGDATVPVGRAPGRAPDAAARGHAGAHRPGRARLRLARCRGAAVARRRRSTGRWRPGVLLRPQRRGVVGAAIDQLRLALAVGALVMIVFALVISRPVARSILAPVEEAGRVAERIERGDLSARVPVTSRDEFGTWAERFNRMTGVLADTIRRLEAAQHQNRRFVADVSHELRTPLAALVAEASIVGDHLDELPPESRRAAELLVADVGRMRALVEELMELSRFDASAEEVAVEPVDVVRLVGAVIAARQPTARFDPPAPSVVVDTDPRRLERILANFLDNAREHAGGDGRHGRPRRVGRGPRAGRLGSRPGRPGGSAAAHLRAVHEARSVAQRRQQRPRPGDRGRARRPARWVPAGDEPRRRRPAPGARRAAACDTFVTLPAMAP